MWKPIVAALVAVTLLLPASDAAALENEDLLALVAMPLAVAAVSEMTDVPMSQLIDVVSLMNDAAVPPVQFVEVVRYAPVALVYEAEGPTFVEYLREREREGLRGIALVDAIERQMTVYGLRDVDFNAPPPILTVIDDRDLFIPPVVHTRLVEWRSSHPHGGPPGQLKKERGLQTGAEVVQGTKPGRDDTSTRVVGRVTDDDRGKDRPKMKPKNDRGDGGGNKGQGKGNQGKGKGGKG
jgi:hypothetical protein